MKIYIVHNYSDPYEPPFICGIFETKEAAAAAIEQKRVEFEEFLKIKEPLCKWSDKSWSLQDWTHDSFIEEYETGKEYR